LASYPKDGEELALLLNIADKNMYADKNAKKG
jgi:GGDEF domain-containing protein